MKMSLYLQEESMWLFHTDWYFFWCRWWRGCTRGFQYSCEVKPGVYYWMWKKLRRRMKGNTRYKHTNSHLHIQSLPGRLILSKDHIDNCVHVVRSSKKNTSVFRPHMFLLTTEVLQIYSWQKVCAQGGVCWKLSCVSFLLCEIHSTRLVFIVQYCLEQRKVQHCLTVCFNSSFSPWNTFWTI